MKTEPAVEEITSHSEPQVRKTDVGSSHQVEASEATTSAEKPKQESSEASRITTETINQTDGFRGSVLTNLLRKGGRM